MQPVLIISSNIPGMVYVNGKFVGEVSAEGTVSMPVAMRGAVYIEHKPLSAGYIPLARRMTLSGGRPVAASLEGETGIQVIVWPSGVVEVELEPEKRMSKMPLYSIAQAEGAQFQWIAADKCMIEVNHGGMRITHPLPDGAHPPSIRQINGRIYLSGMIDQSGQYCTVLSPDFERMLLSAEGREIEIMDEGTVRASIELKDLVGHVRIVTWTPSEDGFFAAHAETVWAVGAPVWPDTPQDTALAAAEAMLLGLTGEAEAYFVPNYMAQMQQAVDAVSASSGATQLKYAMPDGRQAIGVLHMESDNCMAVSPVYYRAVPMGGIQGMWRLDLFEI